MPERDTDRAGRGEGVSGWGGYKRGSRRGSAARSPPRVILLPAAAPTAPGPAAPSTAATNAAAILHWPAAAAAAAAASALCACACAAALSGRVCDDALGGDGGQRGGASSRLPT